jgi:hypothetical protein
MEVIFENWIPFAIGAMFGSVAGFMTLALIMANRESEADKPIYKNAIIAKQAHSSTAKASNDKILTSNKKNEPCRLTTTKIGI